MKTNVLTGLSIATLATGLVSVQAQNLNGTLSGFYGSPLAIQTVNTGFGDSTIGDGSSTGGSELDAAYGQISGGNLYLFIAGNVEQNYNHINLFISDGRAGQSTLSGYNGMAGSTFSPGFSATYALDINGGTGANGTLYIDQYNLVGTPSSSYLGGVSLSGGIGSAVYGGITFALNNTHVSTMGTAGAALSGATSGANTTTGLELAIPLSLLGNPSGSVEVLADVNGGSNGYLSNQFLSGLPVGSGNIGNGGVFNFSSTPGEYFTVTPTPEPTTLALAGLGGLATLVAARRRK